RHPFPTRRSPDLLGQLYCRGCGARVQRDHPESVFQALTKQTRPDNPRLIITFPVTVPGNFTEDEVREFLNQQGYTRVQAQETRERPVVPAKGRGKGRKKTPATESVLVLHV